MKHLFLFNPHAGTGSKQVAVRAEVDRSFYGEDYTVVTTTHAGHAAELAHAACASGEAVRIYACGGDGTLNEVVQGAAGYENAAVTHVPMGTGNDFLRLFGPDAPARFTDFSALKDGPQASFDLMECNGRIGLNVICAGVDARVAADVHRYKALPLISGTGAYVLSLAVNIVKGLSRPMTVEIDGEVLDGGCCILCICNGRYYGGGFMPVGEAMPDDGILNVLYIPTVKRLTFARYVGAYGKGHYRDLPPGVVKAFRCTRVHMVSPEPITAVVDGETVRETELTVALSHQKVNFFYPAGLSYAPAPEFQRYLVSVGTPLVRL